MPAAFDSPYLDLARMEMLRRCRLLPRGTAEGSFAGPHRSRFRGTAVEFADYREYVPGDDVRLIDWKVAARADKHYIKLYEAERNLLSYLMIDSSGSMEYQGAVLRSESKLAYASRLAAALAYLVVDQGDQVGLSLCRDHLHDHLHPGAGWTHLAAVVQRLNAADAQGDTDLGACLQESFGRDRKRGVLLIISDFLSIDDHFWRGIDCYRRSHNDVLLFQVLHPEELDLPDVSLARFIDCEGSGSSFTAEIEVVRRAYSQAMQKHLDGLRAGAATRGCEYYLARTDFDPYHFLKSCLLGRMR